MLYQLVLSSQTTNGLIINGALWDTVLKWLLIVCFVFYVIFAFVVVRQIAIMRKTLITPIAPILTTIGYAHLAISIFITITFILVL